MKMRKIMAAGVAATLAVTSLAAVASAETLTFSMKKTEGVLKYAETQGYDYAKTELTSAEIGAKDDTLTIKFKKAPAGAPTITIKGVKKLDADTPAFETTQTYTVAQNYDIPPHDGLTYTLSVYEKSGPAGSLIPAQWERIDSISVNVQGNEEVVYDEARYNLEDWNQPAQDNEFTFEWNGGYDSKFATEIIRLLGEVKNKGINYSSKYTNEKFALLKQTADTNATIYRNNVKLLSDTEHWESVTDDSKVDGEDQSYDDNGFGTMPYRFAGLASQVADFFNHKTNGTITMKFGTVESTSGWANGGVPSTEVGLRADVEANNFALFINYNSSTGSLQAVTSVDKNAGTVTFDISEILADLGGQTKGVVTDIYYGLNQGITYGWPYNDTGLLIEEITLAYEDDAAEEDIPAEEEEEEVVEEEEEATEEEEEEEVTIEEEEEATEEEEEEVDGEMFEEEETEEEDVNPGTGVALAVVPAMIAAAAAVVSKKRK